MPQRTTVIGGALAAQLLGLDGFSTRDWENRDPTGAAWPILWCGRRSARSAPNVFRTRNWLAPCLPGDQWIAHPAGNSEPLSAPRSVGRSEHLADRTDRTGHRKCSATEPHYVATTAIAVRPGWPCAALATLLDQRGDEPPTESFAETRTVQLLRSLGYVTYRQLPVLVDGRKDYRIDLVIAFERTEHRPKYFTSEVGIGVEVDSHQWHEGRSFRTGRHETQHR